MCVVADLEHAKRLSADQMSYDLVFYFRDLHSTLARINSPCP
jgi:hypothetical protein